MYETRIEIIPDVKSPKEFMLDTVAKKVGYYNKAYKDLINASSVIQKYGRMDFTITPHELDTLLFELAKASTKMDFDIHVIGDGDNSEDRWKATFRDGYCHYREAEIPPFEPEMLDRLAPFNENMNATVKEFYDELERIPGTSQETL